MTKADILAIVDDALGECELHASYSLSMRDYQTTRFTLAAVRLGVRERLEGSKPRSPSTPAAQPETKR